MRTCCGPAARRHVEPQRQHRQFQLLCRNHQSAGQQHSAYAADFLQRRLLLVKNPDVKQFVFNGGVLTGFDHFINWGQIEKRVFSPYFSETYYLAKNPDVASAVAAGVFPSGYAHFCSQRAAPGAAVQFAIRMNRCIWRCIPMWRKPWPAMFSVPALPTTCSMASTKAG